MKAVVWQDTGEVRVENVSDPEIVNPRDAIVRITATSICSADICLYDGTVPGAQPGDIPGHELMGEVVEVGPQVKKIRPGDRVVVACTIACGSCWYCREGLWACCDNASATPDRVDARLGHSATALFGCSRLFGGYSGGQAELARVPFADVGCFRLDGGIRDDQALFLSDLLPAGWVAAESAGIEPEDVVAVFGCGPVGQIALRCARLFGAGRVIAIDDNPERLAMAAASCDAETLDDGGVDVLEALEEMTGGRGPDVCIDATSAVRQPHRIGAAVGRVKHALRLNGTRTPALSRAILSCRKGGTVSVVGASGTDGDRVPLAVAFGKALTVRMGQVHCHRHIRPILERIERGDLDPSFVVTHRVGLDDAPQAYRMLSEGREGCVKVMMQPS